MDADPGSPITRAGRRLSDLAVVSGLYAVGVVGAAYVLTRVPIDASVLAASGLCAVGLYLIDRVKLRDRDLDPADLAAMPERHTFLRRHARLIRAGSIALFAFSSVLFAMHHPWLVAMPLTGLATVVVYSFGPKPGARPKDQLVLKNAIVASGMVCLAGLVLWAHEVEILSRPMLVTLGWLWLTVFADAAMSDLDDAESDEAFRTHTLPNTVGRTRTWLTAIAVQVVAGVGLVLLSDQRPTTWCLAVGVPATTALMWLTRLRRVRDPIDLRLPLVVAVAIGLQALG